MKLETLTDQEILNLVGKKLRELRMSKNVSQQALAQASGLSVFTISQTENGKNVSMLSIIKALRVLGYLQELHQITQTSYEGERKHVAFHHHAQTESINQNG